MAGATETAQQKLDRHPQLQFRLDMKMAQYVKHILEVDLFHTAIKRASCNVEGPDQVPHAKGHRILQSAGQRASSLPGPSDRFKLAATRDPPETHSSKASEQDGG